MYIVDNSGRLISSNIDGVALDSVTEEWGVYATASPQPTISATATGILELYGTWDAANGAGGLVYKVPGVGLTWAASTKVIDDFGLHWHVVVTTVVRCGTGSYLDQELADHSIPCLQCPDETVCDGTSSLESLALNEGHWRISSMSTVVLPCPLKEGCVGGTDAESYCEEGFQGEVKMICCGLQM